MFRVLENSPLFAGLKKEEIEHYVRDSKAKVVDYRKDELVFLQDDLPKNMLVMMKGKIAVCNDSSGGKRSIIAMIEHPGELFGEVFLFLNHKEYEHYAQALEDSSVLEIPKEYFFRAGKGTSIYQSQILANMLGIFARKTYYLNQRLNILSCSSLRQKIARLFVRHADEGGRVRIRMNREEMADFLNTARPSLSRELMKMQDEGLIDLDKKEIVIRDPEALREMI